MFDIEKTVKMMLLEEKINQTGLSSMLGYATRQSVNKMLKKDDHKLSDIIKIADALGYDVSVTFTSRKKKLSFQTNAKDKE